MDCKPHEENTGNQKHLTWDHRVCLCLFATAWNFDDANFGRTLCQVDMAKAMIQAIMSPPADTGAGCLGFVANVPTLGNSIENRMYRIRVVVMGR